MTAVKPRLVILPGGVRADQPAPASVAEGALYFVTDEGLVERNNGTNWDSYSGGAIVTLPAMSAPDAVPGSARLFARDDAAGIAQLCGINEAGTITQLTGIRPVSLVKKSGTQSLADGVRTAVAFDVEAFDIGNTHDNVTNNTRLTVPVGGDGVYFLTANIEFTANAMGVRAAQLRKNGTDALTQVITAAVSGEPTVVQVITIAPLVASDYVELMGYQTSGGALDVGDDDSSFSWTRL
jgi:hypothetical protein